MKIYIIAFVTILMMISSCQTIVDDINENPNALRPQEVDPVLFLNGAQLANSVAQGGHLNRISGLYSGQLIGFTSLYSNIFGYNISTAESVTTWSRFYIGVVLNVRSIRERSPEDPFLMGVSRVLEAHAIGSAASLFGDVPYSEISNPDITDPQFDNQVEVFNAMISLLDLAIADLGAAVSRDEPFDLYFEGDADRWLEAAYTLQARYYLQLKDYANAYSAAQNGVSSPLGNMSHIPRGDVERASGDKNLFWMILEGSRAGDIGTGNSYLMQLLDSANVNNRYNAKTDERARFGYYRVDESSGRANTGIIEQFERQDLISFRENQLILAEAGARSVDLATGLQHLNDLRAFYNTGLHVNENFRELEGEDQDSLNALTHLYLPYDAADFNAGGMENMDNIDPTRALLREIVEERYVSGFLTFMPFNDVRRLRASDSDLIVPFPLNTTSATEQPQRLPYSDDELNANINAPDNDPGIFEITRVNQ